LKRFFFLFVNLFCIVSITSGQSPLRIRSDFSPTYLIKKILLQDESGISVSNIQYRGNERALGAFSNSSKYYLIKRGIILSTGNVEDGIGPNSRPDMGISLGSPGSSELNKISTGKTYDACMLSFDFIPEFDSVMFNFVFASEEYPEFVDKGVNDIFAFFIEDLESGKIKNLAVIGRQEKIVNVDNINSSRNSAFYIENGVWDPDNISQWQSNPGLGELSLTYEYDGFTTLMTAGISVISGKTYRIQFAIADVGDRLYDSAVFLEEGSFKSSGNKENSMKELMLEISQDFKEPSVELREGKESVILSLVINFDFDEYKIKADSSIKILNKISRLLRLHSELNVIITGHTDNYGSEEYNLNLSEQRASFAANFLEQSGVDNARLEIKGYGDNKPVADNVTTKGRLRNRRIEFEFYNSK